MKRKFVIKCLLIFNSILLSIFVTAQNKNDSVVDLRGRVTTTTGTPLEGASVSIKNSTSGTTTNAAGDFFFTQIPLHALLVVSYSGYGEIVIALDGRSQIDIKLSPLVQVLDLPIIIGYGTTSRRKATGSVSRISSEVIEKQPVSNPLAAIAGRMPGVQVIQNNGVPGGSFSIQIRGRNSLRNDGNEPLYIVDGVPFSSTPMASGIIFGSNRTPTVLSNPLNVISINDIESIEVLKDADATSIYGSRGANGVVLITTKKVEQGSTRVDANIYAGVSTLERKMKLLNTQQYLGMRKEAFLNDGETPNTGNFREYFRWDTTRYTDWQEELLGNSANLCDMQLSISGGNKGTQYRVSGGTRRETTVFPGENSYRKTNLALSIDHRSSNGKFKSSFSAGYVVDNSDLPSTDLTYSALTLPPNAPALYDANGDINWENSTWTNPLSYLLQKYGLKNNNLLSNGVLSYNILPNLEIKTSMGLNRMTATEFSTLPLSSYSPASRPGYVSTSIFNTSVFDSWIIEPQLNYSMRAGDSRFSLLAGSTFQENTRELEVLTATNFSNENLMENIKAAANIEATAADHTVYRFSSVFARLNYEFKNSLFLNLSGRQDWSSRFGKGKRNALFYAIGSAWIFTELASLKNSKWLSFGKLRVSYGIAGSDAIGDYNYMQTYEPTTGSYLNIRGLWPTRLANQDYGWEQNKKLEAALELGFLKNRILLTTAYFNNRSSDQLVGYALPPVTGFTSITSNFPAVVRNSGWELQLTADIFTGRRFSWNVIGNITLPENKLIAFPEIENTPYNFSYIVGRSLYIQKKYHFAGVDPVSGRYQFEDAATKVPTLTPSFANDQQGLKAVEQTFYGGVQNSFSHKNLSLDIFFQFVKQQGFNYLYTMARGFAPPGMVGNQPVEILNNWKKAGDISDIQRFTQAYGPEYESYANAQYTSDKTISNASFIRLKNISLTYRFHEKLIGKTFFKGINIFLQAQNLITITDYAGLDPESQLINTLPPLRTITAGFRVSL